jgi:hypothetical protein
LWHRHSCLCASDQRERGGIEQREHAFGGRQGVPLVDCQRGYVRRAAALHQIGQFLVHGSIADAVHQHVHTGARAELGAG